MANIEIRGVIKEEGDLAPYQVKGYPVDKSNRVPSLNAFKTMKDLEVWYHYARWYDHPNGEAALSYLTSKYDRFLHKVANRLMLSNSHEFEYRDFLGFALQGFYYSLATFDPVAAKEKGSTLITWLHSNTYPYANNQRYAARMVSSNSHLRQDIKYAAGGYDHDPNQKEKFEKQRKWQDDSDIALALQRVKLLDTPAMFSEFLDNDSDEPKELAIADDSVVSEDQLVVRLFVDGMKNTFTDLERKIFEYHFEQEWNAQEVAKELSLEYRKTLVLINKVREKSKAYFELEGVAV